MAISINDKRLLEGSQSALSRLRDVPLEDHRAQACVEIAVEVLQHSVDRLKRSMNREDIAALLSGDLESVLKEPRTASAEAMSRVYYSVQKLYADRRTRGEPLTARDHEIRQYLERFNPSDVLTTSLTGASSAWERATEIAGNYIPDEVKHLSTQALDGARRARERLEKAGQNALKAISELEMAREAAKSDYLAARELTSAALRIEGRHAELNDLVPPVSDVMSP